MGCWCQRIQAPSQNWLRPGWMTVALVVIGLCLMYPVLRGIFWQIHSAVTGSYISGDHSLAFINCPNEQLAKEIGRGILEKKLAASVNIMPKSSSLYIWKGEIEESSEVVKTRTAKIYDLSGYIRCHRERTAGAMFPEICTSALHSGLFTRSRHQILSLFRLIRETLIISSGLKRFCWRNERSSRSGRTL
ncbi:protein CutA homolog isoform X2 [Pseudophryne corroboree]|uniref:protein CutA homolog isoform X2 n=1 Tax=Pseudophryne corroboree TaxID=495146 RepID=UPI003081310E